MAWVRFHSILIKSQSLPYTLVCGTYPFITGLDPFTEGFYRIFRRPSRTLMPAKKRSRLGEIGQGKRKKEREKSDGGVGV